MGELNAGDEDDPSHSHEERLRYLDWLRVLAVVGVFYAHAGDIFDTLYWHIRHDAHTIVLNGTGPGAALNTQTTGLNVLAIFGTQWGMSLFFLLAGASAWFALKSRTTGQFIGERFTRLVIPFIVGFILLSPLEAYLLARSRSLYEGSLLQFYPHFFGNIQMSWNPQWLAAYGYHLWFLAFLFFISMLLLPLLLHFRRERGLRLIARLAVFCDRPAGLFVFVLPIALIQIALRAPFPGYQGWADFFTWLAIYLYGYILLANPHFKHAIQKQGAIALYIGIISFMIMLAAHFTGVLGRWSNAPAYSLAYVLYQLLYSIITWSWMVFVLYFGMNFLNFGNKVIQYADEAILPFYILHYPVIVILAFYTIPWSINPGIKFLVISSAALVTTLLIYDLCIRRLNVTRWLFGLKPLKPHNQVDLEAQKHSAKIL